MTRNKSDVWECVSEIERSWLAQEEWQSKSFSPASRSSLTNMQTATINFDWDWYVVWRGHAGGIAFCVCWLRESGKSNLSDSQRKMRESIDGKQQHVTMGLTLTELYWIREILTLSLCRVLFVARLDEKIFPLWLNKRHNDGGIKSPPPSEREACWWVTLWFRISHVELTKRTAVYGYNIISFSWIFEYKIYAC